MRRSRPSTRRQRQRLRSAAWLARRILIAVATLWVVSVLVFAATVALPGDPARAIVGHAAAPARVEAVRQQLGLDRPAVERYLSWLGGVVRGDLGQSLADHKSVVSRIGPAAVNTLTIALLALAISLVVALIVGCWTALHRDGRVDNVLQLITLTVAAIPEFVIGVILVILLATSIATILPAVAIIPPGDTAIEHPNELVLPVATLVLATVPYLIRLIRASVIDALESDYVTMARLKGVPERLVVVRHALRNVIAPLLQAVSVSIAYLSGGIVVVEFLFNFPGLGSALAKAVDTRDVPVIQGAVMVLAAVVVVTNLWADLLGHYLTPRLRSRGQR